MESNTKSIRAGNRLDSKVILTMVVIAAISLAVFGFRYISNPVCRPLKINIEATNDIDSMHFYTGMPLRFSCNLQKGDKCEWSFGTKDNKKSEGQFVTFSYNEPGQYLIGVTANGRCKEFQFITISKAPRLVDPKLIPKIICPVQAIEIGKPVVFMDSTPHAKSWEWRFGESEKVDAVSQTPAYTFSSTGFKTVTLIINGNPDAYATCQIFVNEKAAVNPKTSGGDIFIPRIEEKPETDPLLVDNGPKVTITDQDFSKQFWEIVEGKRDPADFAAYICGGNLQIKVNYKISGSKAKMVSFEFVCNELEEMKERKIKKIEMKLSRDPSNNCVNGMNITVTKKGIL